MQALSSILAVGVTLVGIAIAWKAWGRPSDLPARARRWMPGFTTALEHKLYFDEGYDIVFYRPADEIANGLARRLEGPVILRPIGSFAGSILDLGRRLAATQSGQLRAYATLIALAAAIILLVFIVVR